jgi:hypothetical protein
MTSSYGKMGSMNAKSQSKVKKRIEAIREVRIERPDRQKLTAEESLKRMNDFEKRKDDFIASIRKSKG